MDENVNNIQLINVEKFRWISNVYVVIIRCDSND